MKVEIISIKQSVRSFCARFFESRVLSSFFSKKTSFVQESSGFSLFVILLGVGAMASVFSGTLWYQQNEAVRQKAHASGWHLVQISKAARIYVRDRSTPTSPDFNILFTANELRNASVEVTIDDLIGANLLPQSFPAVNPLGQTVRIFADNYPPSGAPASQVPTAYVMTDVSAQGTRGGLYATTRNMLSLMQGAREAGMSASAPLFLSGTNVSEDCGGDPAVMLWDTGCLNAADVAKVTGGADGGSIMVAEGQVIVPAWRVTSQDFRALMRYPQPENVGANTMLTDLHMGNPENPNLFPNNYTSGEINRFNINNVGDLNVIALIAQDQGSIGGSNNSTDSLDLYDMGIPDIAPSRQVLNVAGDFVVSGGNLNVANNSELPGTIFLPSNGNNNPLNVTGEMTARNMTVSNIFTSEQDPDDINFVTVQNIAAGSVTDFSAINAQNFETGDDLVISGNDSGNMGGIIAENITNVGSLQIEGDGAGSATELRVFGQMEMSTTGLAQIELDNSATEFNSAKLRAGELQDPTVILSDPASTVFFNVGGRVEGETRVGGMRVDICAGDCPDELSNNPPEGPIDPEDP